jgi:arabinofuranosyltransferase
VLATAFLVGLGVLVRPDFAVFCAAFAVPVGMVAWRRRRWRSLVAAGAAAAALPLVVQIMRMGYYGQLFPNTLYAKEGSRSWWSQGWHYLTNFASPYALVIPVVVTLLWLGLSWRQAEPSPRTRSWRVVVVSTELAALGHTIAVVRAGGDYMHARLLLPGWFALLLPLFAVPLGDLRLPSRAPGARLMPSLRLAGFATLLVWGIAAAALWRPPPGTLFGAELSSSHGSIDLGDVRIVDGRQMTVGTTGAEHRILVEDTHTELRSVAESLRGRILVPGYYEGLWRGAAPLPGSPEVGRPVIPVGAAGADGFATPLDVWVYDTLGLGDAIVARLQLDHRGTPGHEKMLSAAWVAAMYVDPNVYLDPEKFAPSGILLQNVAGVNLPGQLDEEEFEADRAAATKALHCGDLRELIERTREPLTPGRFFGNLVGAVGLDSFRFDIDPQVAEKALCD